ncbi:PLAC8-domain-containing protein [Trematosphaeria pertusa]|uniref:PLAC8-domain-containing protein n=1 Tax=Trematosphaeria pertusa TaxID=390896 RepID=A0A6A6IKH2_9PLEO|nr:PLAC8-domain-containing protein [Trematosphaeria pertusa]KAF2250060.1 PLAC8-domain-containing protein [Trematosphaeria pertusa]
MTTIQKQEWHHSGASCCSPIGTCCLAWWCPCILFGRTRYRTKNNGNMSGHSCCNGSCAAFCGLMCLGVPFILPWINRGDMRAKYHLKGNGCTDCLCACCCTPCDMVQQEKEVIYRENQPLMQQPGKEHMNYAQQQYAPQQQQYAPQQQQPHFHHG